MDVLLVFLWYSYPYFKPAIYQAPCAKVLKKEKSPSLGIVATICNG
jgi:hypothetical protein